MRRRSLIFAVQRTVRALARKCNVTTPTRIRLTRLAIVSAMQLRGDVHGETLGHRSQAESATARFWLGNSIPIFMQIARQISVARDLGLSENARFFALVSIAGIDAYIAAWDAKYTYNFWRPVTAIRPANFDRNPATIGDPRGNPFPHGRP